MAVNALLLVLLALPAEALQAPFGPTGTNIRYTDSSNLTYRGIECTWDHLLHFNHFMYFTMEDDYEAQTDLMTTKLEPTGCNLHEDADDIYWYATAQSNLSSANTAGDWWCKTKNSTTCFHGRIRFAERLYDTGSNATKWNTACHEIAHAVGFDHGNTGNNCMDGGNNGIIDQYMINKINDQY